MYYLPTFYDLTANVECIPLLIFVYFSIQVLRAFTKSDLFEHVKFIEHLKFFKSQCQILELYK